MKILLTNDDGYRAKGIEALYAKLSMIADVVVIAPEHNNSGKSNSLTLTGPLYVHEASNGFKYVTGTPADCVHIALTSLLDERPDLVVSGLNNGANMGDDTIYSGTVAAAMEGYLFGIPGIAFSSLSKRWDYLDDAVEKAFELLQSLDQRMQGIAQPWLLNVNIPAAPYEQLGDFEWCRLGRRHNAEAVIKQLNPHGEMMYWMGAAGVPADDGEGTDFCAVRSGNISVTPLQIDLTNVSLLANRQGRVVKSD